MRKDDGRRYLSVSTYAIVASAIMLAGILTIFSAFLSVDKVLLYVGLFVTGGGVAMSLIGFMPGGKIVSARRKKRSLPTLE